MIALLALSAFAADSPPSLRLDLDDVRPTREAVDLTLDPTATTFSGTATIDLHVSRKTSLLWLNATGLTITSADVGGEPVTVVPGDDQFVGFRTSSPVSGDVRLRATFTGPVSDVDTQGVFRQREGDDWYLFSQFEATDARRAFPCVDQPDAKIPWQVTLHVPPGDGAFSNTAPTSSASTSAGSSADGTVVFAETKPLPSYLVAFAVGPFDVVDAGTAGRNHVPVRIVAPRGEAAWADYAAKTTGETVSRLEDWFDVPYPYDKLDVVVLPQTVGFGAMENAGMVTVVQSVALSRPEDDTISRQREYVVTIAHELAHQWFGDLVTPRWWDDIWLNESFASWMETKLVEDWHPEWHADVDRVANRDEAMRQDSLTSARRIRQPIASMDDIENAFDGITYGKGEAVLEMFEASLGPDTFRKGVQGYLRAHSYGNATADDFVTAMSQATGHDLAPAFSTFLDQPGVPLVTMDVDCDASPVLRVAQQRYLPEGSSGKARQRWDVPLRFRYVAGGQTGKASYDLKRRKATIPLGTETCPDWLLPNDDMTGYYRVAAGEELFTALLDPKTPLTVPERVGVVGDASALVAGGRLAPTVVLKQVPALVGTDDPRLMGETVDVVAALDDHLVAGDVRPRYRAFVEAMYGDVARRLGMTSPEGEEDELRLLRPQVVGLVGGIGGDEPIRAAASQLADRWLTSRDGVDPDMVSTVLGLYARAGDEKTFERLRDEATKEKDRERRERILGAMGALRDPDAVRAALDWAMTDAVDIREAFPVVAGPLSHAETQDVAWAWVKEHIDAIEAKVPSIARGYLPFAAAGFCDEEHRKDAEAFFAPKAKKWIGGTRNLAQALEAVDLCVAQKKAQEPEVEGFLSAYGG